MGPRSAKEQRVLVVEDEAVIGRVCRKVLADHGFTVDVVPDGHKAVDMLRKRGWYDICILDLRMPGIDGFQLYEYLAGNHPRLSRNVVFMTGDFTNNHVSEFLNDSERVCLQKPFTPQDLLAAVKKATNKQPLKVA